MLDAASAGTLDAASAGTLDAASLGSPAASATSRPAAPRWPGHSALVVPVPALEPFVRWRTRHYDPAYLSAAPSFAHAHVTLLGPFVDVAELTPSLGSEVARVLLRHRAFTAWFEEVAQFPDGMIHLLPRDERPFRRFTADLAAAFPDHPPYGGRHPEPRPHLTLDRAAPEVDIQTVRRWVEALVPTSVAVQEARLSWYEQDACRTLASWPLG
jgi:hypothetical protein